MRERGLKREKIGEGGDLKAKGKGTWRGGTTDIYNGVEDRARIVGRFRKIS